MNIAHHLHYPVVGVPSTLLTFSRRSFRFTQSILVSFLDIHLLFRCQLSKPLDFNRIFCIDSLISPEQSGFFKSTFQPSM